MNAECQLHWWGYKVRDGKLEAPIQAASSTARARATISSRMGGDAPVSVFTDGSEELSTAR